MYILAIIYLLRTYLLLAFIFSPAKPIHTFIDSQFSTEFILKVLSVSVQDIHLKIKNHLCFPIQSHMIFTHQHNLKINIIWINDAYAWYHETNDENEEGNYHMFKSDFLLKYIMFYSFFAEIMCTRREVLPTHDKNEFSSD